MAPNEPHYPIAIRPRKHTCWLSAIIGRTPTHFIYTISLREEKNYHGFLRIPSSRVRQSMKKNWDDQVRALGGDTEATRINIHRSEHTQGMAQLGDILCLSDKKDEYVRSLDVHFNGETFKGGEVRVPRKEFEVEAREAQKKQAEELQRAQEEADAIESIEYVEECSPRRTVVFTVAPQTKSMASVEIWRVDGKSSYETKAFVKKVLRPGDGRRHVTIRSRIPETLEWVDMKGDLDIHPGQKMARCEEIGPRAQVR